jgi:hypothetical protein
MWSDAIYVQFPDEATARAAGASLGIEFPEDGSIPSGNENYALCAPIQPPWQTDPVYNAQGDVTTPGVLAPGFWAMLRFNEAWPGYAATVAALEASGAVRELANPHIVWA